MNAERALISWIPSDEGGRQAPPAGPRYVGVARFEEDERWPDEAWSLVVEFVRTVHQGRYTLADVRFLADDAPARLLHRGSRFTLMEGARRVAKGVVLAASTPVPDQMSEFEASLIG